MTCDKLKEYIIKALENTKDFDIQVIYDNKIIVMQDPYKVRESLPLLTIDIGEFKQ